MPSGRDQWVAVAKAIYSRFGEVQVTDRAAAMTYYSILSLFPALLVVVSLLALIGAYPETYQSIVQHPPRCGARYGRRHHRQRPAGFPRATAPTPASCWWSGWRSLSTPPPGR